MNWRGIEALGGELRNGSLDNERQIPGWAASRSWMVLGKKWWNNWTLITSTDSAMMMPSRGLAGAVRQGARLNRRFVRRTRPRWYGRCGLTRVRCQLPQDLWLHSTPARQAVSSRDPSFHSPHMLVLPRHQHLLPLPPCLPPRTLLLPHLPPMRSRPTATPSTLVELPTSPTYPRGSDS